jgi:hypothetical protein
MVTASREYDEGFAPPIFPHERCNRKVNLLAVREVVEDGHRHELAFRNMLQLFAYFPELIEESAPGVVFADALADERKLAIE